MSMRRGVWQLLPLLCVVFAPGAVHAHNQKLPLDGTKLSVYTNGAAKRRMFSFRSVNQPIIVIDHNPITEGSALVVAGSDGKTGLIQLDPTHWRGLGRPAGSKPGYMYFDKTRSRGGVRSITYKPGTTNGGTLTISGGGPNWPWSPAGAQSSVWVHFLVGDEWYCAQFGGTFTRNKAGVVRAKKANAPASCPLTVCGNGIQESGEECDDGNLNNTDGCTTSCTVGTCSGQVFDSTWQALQKVILSDGGCTNSICHGSTPPVQPAGGLDLRPANAHANLVNVASTASGLHRVEPGDQDLSFLYLKLAAATLPGQYPPSSIPGSPMPAGGNPPISTDALAALRLWIRAGAPVGGVVEGTAPLLSSCLPPASPQKIPPLSPPAAGTGVQLYAPPWNLLPQSENEVCFSTYYDFSLNPALVPLSAQTPCPAALGGSSQTCLRYHETELAQDPQSHHSIIHIYRGAYDTTDPGWGQWTCKGGVNDGLSCDPKQLGVPVSAGGAECGPRSGCTGEAKRTAGCVFYGPPDYGFFNNVSPTFGGSQEPLTDQTYAPGVYSVLPMKGIVVWNSHAFNLTNTPTTMEQYYNFTFAQPADQSYPLQGAFDDTEIFVENVPAFETREYCRTFTFPPNSHAFEFSSHRHKRGVLFRIWAPPNATENTTCTGAGGCLPNPDPPFYQSTEYNDPVRLAFSPPIDLRGLDAAHRSYKFCTLYDNGAADHSTVKRRSTSPVPPVPLGGPCLVSQTRCIDGPHHNELCNGSNVACDSSLGAGDGDCDACPLHGGVTTEDEMWIFLGSYYIAP